MLESIGGHRHRFEDFRENGLLLPCDEIAALRMGLPMHRGPHRLYSQLVATRVGQIERAWASMQRSDPQAAAVQAHMRMDLLQRALRRYLLDGQRRRLKLNSRDPLQPAEDFAELDAMAEALWGATGVTMAPMAQPMPVRARRSVIAD